MSGERVWLTGSKEGGYQALAVDSFGCKGFGPTPEDALEDLHWVLAELRLALRKARRGA